MLNLALASLVLLLLLDLECQLAPLAEEASDILHSVVRVEQGSHSVEQVLVPVKIFFFLDELELEPGTDRLIL